MGNDLKQIAQQLIDANKKVQLIYAFNGTGKTRLSKEFKQLISPKTGYEESDTHNKILYYNAFTEDLFSWDNDLENDSELKLKIHPNSFTKWILQEQGKEENVIQNFHHYTDKMLTPHFNPDYSEVIFSFTRGNQEPERNIKISKGEESSFIWSIFYSLMEQIIFELNISDAENRSTDDFNDLEYIFIDDPVSSLDENHLIELAVNIAKLINYSDFTNGNGVRFIITTHNPLFYNVLFNELQLNQKKGSYMLLKNEDGSFELDEKKGDSNKSFSYHLYLKHTLEEAIEQNNIQKYHFTLVRNLYEKTANFLGYPQWSELLPNDNKQGYYNRIIQFTSHSTLSNEAVAEPTDPEKQTVKLLFSNLIENYNFWKQVTNNES